jgi:hypothetical protein
MDRQRYKDVAISAVLAELATNVLVSMIGADRNEWQQEMITDATNFIREIQELDLPIAASTSEGDNKSL